MVIAALAWNLKSWFSMMLHRKTDRREHIAMEFRRFITSIILIPAHVIRRARSITIRLSATNPASTASTAPRAPSNAPASTDTRPQPNPPRIQPHRRPPRARAHAPAPTRHAQRRLFDAARDRLTCGDATSRRDAVTSVTRRFSDDHALLAL
jgi:hypothetical protein